MLCIRLLGNKGIAIVYYSFKKGGDKKMNKNDIIRLKEHRLSVLKSNGKNVDSNGIIRKLEREIRNLNK